MHERFHTQDDPGIIFQCNTCDWSFTTESLLNEHQQSAHEQSISIVQCAYCVFTTSSEESLQTHIESVHEVIPMVQDTAPASLLASTSMSPSNQSQQAL